MSNLTIGNSRKREQWKRWKEIIERNKIGNVNCMNEKRLHLNISLWDLEDTKYKEKILKKNSKEKRSKTYKGVRNSETLDYSSVTQAEEFFQRTRGHCFPIGILYPQELWSKMKITPDTQEFWKIIFHELFQKKKLKDVLKHNKEEKQERDLGSRKQQI